MAQCGIVLLWPFRDLLAERGEPSVPMFTLNSMGVARSAPDFTVRSQGEERWRMMVVAALCAGLFAGAAIYISAVEHPARLSCGTELAVREFAPSYHRATFMQASLAIAGCAASLWSAWARGDAWLVLAAVLLGSVVPYTLVVILPTNNQLLDPTLDPAGPQATALLVRWGRLHLARSILSSIAFLVFLLRLAP
jgi:Anthrone oxygenase